MQSIKKYTRSAGVLLPLTMLHGPFGIGVIGAEAISFIDFLQRAGFRAWQVLPLENTGVCFSPYKCISAFAGEAMLIDPRMLLDMGLITGDELAERCEGLGDGVVEYELVRRKQWPLLKTAFLRLADKPYADFNPFWLDNYTLYMSIKHNLGDLPWFEWPDAALKRHDKSAVDKARLDYSEDIEFYKFVQWLFDKQWSIVKDYAAARGISVIGDMPIYVSEDSAEVWSRQDLFEVDGDGNFETVGGVPPDYFNADGQRWGNPVYNWKLMKRDGYQWWIDRLKVAIDRYGLVRLDHFRGFDSYWCIPADSPTARNGKWKKGPGKALFRAMKSALGELPVIAEDLGEISASVERLLKETDFRGMRVLQFAFLGDDYHLPHNFTQFDVAYTGTHDNTTLLGWMFDMDPELRDLALDYIGFDGDWTQGGPNCAINKAWIRALFMSGASLAVIPIQDALGYGGDTRTNTPGTSEGNWRFRIQAGAIDQIDESFYGTLIKRSFRQNAPTEYLG